MAVIIKVKWSGAPAYNGYNHRDVSQYVKNKTNEIFRELNWLEEDDSTLMDTIGSFHVGYNGDVEIFFDNRSQQEKQNRLKLNVFNARRFARLLARKYQEDTQNHNLIDIAEFFYDGEQQDSMEFYDEFAYDIIPNEHPDRKYLRVNLSSIQLSEAEQ